MAPSLYIENLSQTMTVTLFKTVFLKLFKIIFCSRSEDGRYLVTGECGHLPSVRVWDIQDRSCVGEFPGHKYGINCVAFAPNNKYIVSVRSISSYYVI